MIFKVDDYLREKKYTLNLVFYTDEYQREILAPGKKEHCKL